MKEFEDRKQETREVKKYLEGQGYKGVKVGHGKGTAWGWLHVSVCTHRPMGCYCTLNQYGQWDRCHYCKNKWQEEYSKIENGLMIFTGRTGDYGGRIGIDIELKEIINENLQMRCLP